MTAEWQETIVAATGVLLFAYIAYRIFRPRGKNRAEGGCLSCGKECPYKKRDGKGRPEC